MIKSFIKYFRSYYKEVMISYNKWVDKHKIRYSIVASIDNFAIAYECVLYLARKNNKALKSNDYEEEES